MATLDIIATLCTAPGCTAHVKVSAALNGGAAQFFDVGVDEIRGTPPDERERMEFLINLLRLATQGLTKVQARNKLTTGFTVTF